MNIHHNKRLAKILMVVGLCLLTLGLCLWNISEYHRGKIELKDDLDNLLSQIISEAKADHAADIIKYVLKYDSTNMKTVWEQMDSLESQNPFFFIANDSIEAKANSPINRFPSTGTRKTTEDTLITFDISTSNSFFQSLDSSSRKVDRLETFTELDLKSNPLRIPRFLNKKTDSINISVSTNDYVAKLRKNLTTQLDQQKNHLAIQLIETQDQNYESNPNQNLRSRLEKRTFNPDIFLEISQESYTRHIFWKLLPQILFSLLVLGIISLAFLLTYRTLKKQEELNSTRNDFMNNMTHELKTPITTIGVALEAIRNFGVDANPELRKEYIDISRSEVDRLSLLVDKVLNISKFEDSGIQLEKEDIQLDVLVEKISKTLKIQFQKHQAKLESVIDENLYIQGDKSHISNVIYNLIDNALKYGGSPPQLLIELREEGEFALLSITDNGKGIPKEKQSKIFEKFYRVPQQDIHNIKGHGLGLSYVKKIIELHGGITLLESEVGKGSTFTIKLPINHG